MNGTLQAFVASDLAELIMENWRSCNTSYQNEFLSAESWPPSSEYERNTHLSVFREMLLAGATKVRQNYSCFWGYFFLFAHVVDLTSTLAHGRKSTYIVPTPPRNVSHLQPSALLAWRHERTDIFNCYS